MNNSQNRWLRTAAGLCNELAEDDGIDPRREKKRSAETASPSIKNLQLSKTAERLFSLFFSSETEHPLLRQLSVVSVVPEHNGKQLCIDIAYPLNEDGPGETQILSALHCIQGELRYRLAQQLHRKKVPGLRFRTIGRTGQGAV